jgi:RNA polymerase sigma factor (TIGR02999 family)
MPSVYDELRRVAASYFRSKPAAETLQPTALVHEAYLKLASRTSAEYESRAHFTAVAATAMRHILVDHARGRGRAKRGGGIKAITLNEALIAAAETEDVDVLRLDDALTKLAELDPRRSRVVELRFFGGLNIEETATVLGVARSTVTEDWRLARAWLACELRQGDNP